MVYCIIEIGIELKLSENLSSYNLGSLPLKLSAGNELFTTLG